ncbi:hypothetical protein ACQI4L_27015 [Mycolicibacterium litorale]|uniref:hypothetical protein n=1 Tax=Mycolicibacterium litorale TaxID=758802 RepID=UPI003CEDAD02
MRILRSAIVGAAALVVLPPSLVVTAPAAVAECTESAGITMCQNEVRRADTGPAEQDVWYPYPCEADYLCNDGDSVFNIIVPPDRPDRPDFGRPGRPGDRPDGGGGGGGGGIVGR